MPGMLGIFIKTKAMEFTVKRKWFTDKSAIGELHINGTFFCYTLEDTDRDLYKTQPLTEIAQKKLFGITAIPYGKYDLALTFSNRFKKYMPQVLNVPAYEGVRIHSGNKPEDTEGCLLVGMQRSENFVGDSKAAFNALMAMFKKVEKKEKITIEYIKEGAVA